MPGRNLEMESRPSAPRTAERLKGVSFRRRRKSYGSQQGRFTGVRAVNDMAQQFSVRDERPSPDCGNRHGRRAAGRRAIRLESRQAVRTGWPRKRGTSRRGRSFNCNFPGIRVGAGQSRNCARASMNERAGDTGSPKDFRSLPDGVALPMAPKVDITHWRVKRTVGFEDRTDMLHPHLPRGGCFVGPGILPAPMKPQQRTSGAMRCQTRPVSACNRSACWSGRTIPASRAPGRAARALVSNLAPWTV
jgi:hypothetical protein